MKHPIILGAAIGIFTLGLASTGFAKTMNATFGTDGQSTDGTNLSCTYPITVSSNDTSDDVFIINHAAMGCRDPERNGDYAYNGSGMVFVHTSSLNDIQSVIDTKKMKIDVGSKTCDAKYFNGGSAIGIGECYTPDVNQITVILPKNPGGAGSALFNVYVTYGTVNPR